MFIRYCLRSTLCVCCLAILHSLSRMLCRILTSKRTISWPYPPTLLTIFASELFLKGAHEIKITTELIIQYECFTNWIAYQNRTFSNLLPANLNVTQFFKSHLTYVGRKAKQNNLKFILFSFVFICQILELVYYFASVMKDRNKIVEGLSKDSFHS